MKISVVINTYNEEKHIERVIKSVNFADEVLVCDMHSDDNTAVIAKKLGAKVIFHKRLSYVEPARNFAVSKSQNDWVLVLDPDEEIPPSLADKLKQIASETNVTIFVDLPRKNIIFDKWIKTAMWWPDYNPRFFKKGNVSWSEKIHEKPKTLGQGISLPAEERYAIVHHHYESISQYLEKLNRYTSIQAKNLVTSGYKFEWKDLISKPLGEFLSRYFALRGFEDGLHGLSLALLQAFSHLIMYLKVWELEGFEKRSLNLNEVSEEATKAGKEINYWFKYGNLSKNPLKKLLQRVGNKLTD